MRACRNGHKLAGIFKNDANLAAQVKILHVVCEVCQTCDYALSDDFARQRKRLTRSLGEGPVCKYHDGAMISRLVNLTILRMGGCWDELLPHLAQLPRMYSLRLEWEPEFGMATKSIPLDLLLPILQLPQLQQLELHALTIKYDLDSSSIDGSEDDEKDSLSSTWDAEIGPSDISSFTLSKIATDPDAVLRLAQPRLLDNIPAPIWIWTLSYIHNRSLPHYYLTNSRTWI